MIREIFYDHFGKAKPNEAHLALARLEAAGRAQDASSHRTSILCNETDEEALSNSLQGRTSFSGSTEQRAKSSSSKNVLCYHRRSLDPHSFTFRNSVGGSIRMPLNVLRFNRCRSPEMMYFAPAATAHSMNLLSAGSSVIAEIVGTDVRKTWL